MSQGTLAELARVMPPGGELRIATDIADYAEWILLAVRRQGGFRWTAKRRRRLARAGQRTGLKTRYMKPRLCARAGAAATFASCGPEYQGPDERGPPDPSATWPQQPGRARCLLRCDKNHTSRLQLGQFPLTILLLMIISTLRVGPPGPLFLF